VVRRFVPSFRIQNPHPCSLPRAPDQWFLTLCVCAPVDAQWPRDDDRGEHRQNPSFCRRHCSAIRLLISHACLPLVGAQSDFYATDAGRQHFADQLKSIRYCVQEVRTPFDSPCPVLSVHNPLTGSPLCLSYRPPTVRRFHYDSIGLMPRPLPLYSPASLLCISSRRSLRVFDLRQLRLQLRSLQKSAPQAEHSYMSMVKRDRLWQGHPSVSPSSSPVSLHFTTQALR